MLWPRWHSHNFCLPFQKQLFPHIMSVKFFGVILCAFMLNATMVVASPCGARWQADEGQLTARGHEISNKSSACGTCTILITCLNPHAGIVANVSVTDGIQAHAYYDISDSQIYIEPRSVDGTIGHDSFNIEDGPLLILINTLNDTEYDEHLSITWSCVPHSFAPYKDRPNTYADFDNSEGGRRRRSFQGSVPTKSLLVIPSESEMWSVSATNAIGRGSASTVDAVSCSVVFELTEYCALEKLLGLCNRKGTYTVWTETSLAVVLLYADPTYVLSGNYLEALWGPDEY